MPGVGAHARLFLYVLRVSGTPPKTGLEPRPGSPLLSLFLARPLQSETSGVRTFAQRTLWEISDFP